MILPLFVLLCGMGCGNFAARRMAQAPNTYPTWFTPNAPVTLRFSEKLLTGFPNQYLQIPSPAARIRYRIIDPGDYQFHWTNRVDEAKGTLDLSFDAKIASAAERTNRWSQNPRGLVVLLHGYGVAGFAMLPWAFLLAQEGWRCVLVDLRGHGRSTGKQIYFGTQEIQDLSALLDQLGAGRNLAQPVCVVGHSYGAVLALRWKLRDPRLDKVVAMSPYADLASAAQNIRQQYAPWVPKSFVTAGLHKLPELLHVPERELNPDRWMEANHETALFVAGEADRIAPPDQVERLYELAGPGNKLLLVPRAAHELLPFYLDALAAPVNDWLSGQSQISSLQDVQGAGSGRFSDSAPLHSASLRQR